ncbi:hypothetical protein GGF46_004234 [Coemansia sp. RSA 552]|nr:hypothetical protein GGF46_004234 [Coemansia sp. RSA 552]
MILRCWRLARLPPSLALLRSSPNSARCRACRGLQWARQPPRPSVRAATALGSLIAAGAVGGGLWAVYGGHSVPKTTGIEPAAEQVASTPAEEAPVGGIRGLWRAVVVDGVWELVLTVVRTGELLVYFVPLILAYPLVWFGQRDADRGNETAGALWWYRMLRIQMSCAGPTFVKLAQWAASRTDLFSAQLCVELGRLHDSNRTHAARISRSKIARAFGMDDIGEVFERFDDVPLGAGAVAQVHRGRLAARFGESRDVAVKVLHPGVERMIARDLRIMYWGARVLSLLPGMRWLSLPEEVAVFGTMMRAQVDLRVEARNAEAFRTNFRARGDTVSFPSTRLALDAKDVLVESFCDGVPLRTFLDIDGQTPFDRELGAWGLDAFLNMLIYDNFVHADLHPGNILVTLNPPLAGTSLDRFVEDFYDMSPFNRGRGSPPESSDVHRNIRAIIKGHDQGVISRRERDSQLHQYIDLLYRSGFTASLVFLDCGLVTSLDHSNRRNFIDLFESVCTFDGQRAGSLMIERCLTPDKVIAPDIFILRMQDIIWRVRRVSLQLSKLTFGEIFDPVMRAVRIHHVRLAPDFINIIMAMFVLEGIGRRLDPDSDVLRAALPMLRKWLREDAKNELVLQQQEEQQRRRGSLFSSTSLNLLKVWLYIEFREYIARIRDWGYDDSVFFGPFAPFLTADSSIS